MLITKNMYIWHMYWRAAQAHHVLHGWSAQMEFVFVHQQLANMLNLLYLYVLLTVYHVFVLRHLVFFQKYVFLESAHVQIRNAQSKIQFILFVMPTEMVVLAHLDHAFSQRHARMGPVVVLIRPA